MGAASRARILITGGGGQLARALARRLGAGSSPQDRVFMAAEAELDIANLRSVRNAVEAHRPDWIINCAAYTAVDDAEGEPERAFRVNDLALGILAGSALDSGARLLHVSTDYVFDGTKREPYVEEDPPNPLNIYGLSKFWGERRLLAHPARSAILRTAWLYGEEGKNFFRWAAENGARAVSTGEPLPLVQDQVGCPTDVHTLSAQIEVAIEEDLRGLFHAASEGSASWLEFGREIFAGLGLDPPVKAVRGEELSRLARRPARVVLENRRLKILGRHRMIPWREGLRGVLERFRGRR